MIVDLHAAAFGELLLEHFDGQRVLDALLDERASTGVRRSSVVALD